MNVALAGAQDFSSFKSKKYFSSLDGLRAASIALVLLHHVPRYSGPFIRTLQENGRYGVSFFFVISGFLICTLLLREEETTGAVDLRAFYLRRALRLLPLYYAVLIVQAVLVYRFRQYTPENQALFTYKLPSYVFYYSNWLASATQGPFFQAWSLAVEEQFYVVFGIILAFRSRRFLVGAVLGGLLVKFTAYSLFGPIDADSTVWRVIFSYREPILLRVLAAVALDGQRGYRLFQEWIGWAGMPLGLGLAIGGLLCFHEFRHESYWDAQVLYVLMCLTVICLVVRQSTGLISGRVAVHVGKVSYGIYLLHMFVISAVKKWPWGASPAFCLVASTGVVILLASVVFRYFEQPIIAFYKRNMSPLHQSSAGVTPGEGIKIVPA